MNGRNIMYEADKARLVSAPSSGDCAVSPPRDVPEVARALSELRCVFDRYENLAGRFHDRLSCVTAPSNPQTTSGENKEGGYCTTLASEIDAIRRNFRDITNGLEDMYERIEL